MTDQGRAAAPSRSSGQRAPTATTFASLPWSGILPSAPESWFHGEQRPVDYGLGPLRCHWTRLAAALRFVWAGRRADRLVVCHAGTEVLIASVLRPILARRAELIAVDFLRPPRLRDPLLRALLRGVQRFVVIRSGDIGMLAGLGVTADRCVFVPFPAPRLPPHPEGEAYVYSAGYAQRDWPTLFEALRLSQVPAVVAGPVLPPSELDNVRYVGVVSPTQGRQLLTNCRFAVHSSLDTLLPSGPLLILDALALGKPVVATNSNGSRDYVIDGYNGLVVPPGDPAALGGAIAALFRDASKIEALRRGALESVEKLTPEAFWAKALAA